MSRAAWVSSSDRALTVAAGQIRLIRAVTPVNADSELAELAGAFARKAPRLPRWRYEARPIAPELPRALEQLAAFLDQEPPLGPLYAARARELRLEAELVAAAGTPALTVRARERFLPIGAEGDRDHREADALALAWTREPAAGEVRARSRTADQLAGMPRDAAAPAATDAGSSAGRDLRRARGAIGTDPIAASPRFEDLAAASTRHGHDDEAPVRSCDETNPRSLLSRMASEVGRMHLPMRVSVQAGMASLAATGDGVILVAKNKWLLRRDVERTVMHEIEGHALPRARAARAPVALFAFGTARGIDDQEGRALVVEERAGFLDRARKFELGCRHLAAKAALDGADFVEIVALLRARGAPSDAALRIAARVQRGSHGVGGLGREVVYLSSQCKVARLLAGPDGHEIEQVMRGGRVAADVALELDAALSHEARAQRSERDGHFRRNGGDRAHR